MSSFGGLFVGYTDSYDLHVKTGQAMIALSAVTLIAGVVQGVRHRKPLPLYILACLGAFTYLLQAAITGSLNQSMGELEGMFPPAMAAYFFGSIFPPIAWIIVFYTFQAALPAGEGRKVLWGFANTKLISTFLGYLWAFIIIVAAVGFAGTAGSIVNRGSISYSTYRQALNAYHTAQFVNYGLWAFWAFFIHQMWESYAYVRPFLYTFAGYVFLVFLIVVGRTVATSSAGDESAAVSIEAVNFVLAQLFGLFALGIVITVGHTWTVSEGSSKPVLPVTTEQTTSPSATTPAQQHASPSSDAAADKTEVNA
ncbi:hypothetical protein BDB00DRAFT_826595 [Zychaea mexicana]|uniref:uncharacterized protein n=1 Tax=Zychaea mexicana TaxID=64656 RepID=UPI0022FE08F6|nr:uncharacterized protein BDB00DRAFT_826595 [Zychaea mexicana]KAI9492833.1 hypothetical protein BDB00DRAFT_826595 [Zychaea mexicana]